MSARRRTVRRMPWVDVDWPKPHRKMAQRKFRARQRQALRHGAEMPAQVRCFGWYW